MTIYVVLYDSWDGYVVDSIWDSAEIAAVALSVLDTQSLSGKSEYSIHEWTLNSYIDRYRENPNDSAE